jgi:TIR domain
MKDFFVSYTGVDRKWATWITWHLEEAGYTAVFQVWDFRPGFNFVLEMDRAVKDTDRVLAVLSNEYLAARYTCPEWAEAFRQDPTGKEGKLVPVRVKECNVQGLLASIVYVDLVGLEENEARTALIAGVSRGRPKPTIPPPFPIAAHRSVPVPPPSPFEEVAKEAMDITGKLGTLLEERMTVLLELDNLCEEKAELREQPRPAISTLVKRKVEELDQRIKTLDVQIEKLNEQRKLPMKKMQMINEAGRKAMQDIWRDKK